MPFGLVLAVGVGNDNDPYRVPEPASPMLCGMFDLRPRGAGNGNVLAYYADDPGPLPGFLPLADTLTDRIPDSSLRSLGGKLNLSLSATRFDEVAWEIATNPDHLTKLQRRALKEGWEASLVRPLPAGPQERSRRLVICGQLVKQEITGSKNHRTITLDDGMGGTAGDMHGRSPDTTGGGTWATQPTSSGEWEVDGSGEAFWNAADDNVSYDVGAWDGKFHADYRGAGADDDFNVRIRTTLDPNDDHYRYIIRTGADTVILAKKVGGANTVLLGPTASGFDATTTYRPSIEATGSTITGDVDDSGGPGAPFLQDSDTDIDDGTGNGDTRVAMQGGGTNPGTPRITRAFFDNLAAATKDIAVAVASVSGGAADVSRERAVAAQIAATSSGAAGLGRGRAIVLQTAASSAASAGAGRARSIDASSASTSAASGAVARVRAVIATASATSSASAALARLRAVVAACAALSAAAAAIFKSAFKNISVSASAVSSAAVASARRNRKVAATAASTSAGSSVLSRLRGVAGSVSASGTAGAVLYRLRGIDVLAAAVSAAAAVLEKIGIVTPGRIVLGANAVTTIDLQARAANSVQLGAAAVTTITLSARPA